jgi:hypothetical protein
MRRLGPEERLIVDVLKQFGALRMDQIQQLLYNKTESTVYSIVKSLIKNELIVHESNYLKVLPGVEPNPSVIDTFSVMLHFIHHIAPGGFFRVRLPYQIMFLMKDNEYDIMSYQPGDMAMLDIAQHDESIKNGATLILAIRGESLLDELPVITAPKALIGLIKDDEIQILEVENCRR